MHFDDGTVKEYSANVIAERIYAQVYNDENEYRILEEVFDHQKDGHAVSRNDIYITGKNVNKHMLRMTKE